MRFFHKLTVEFFVQQIRGFGPLDLVPQLPCAQRVAKLGPVDLVVRIKWSFGRGRACSDRGDGSELTCIMRNVGYNAMT